MKVGSLFREWRFFILLLLLVSLFRSAMADWYTVPTGSMKPTILEGDRIFVNKMAYGLRVPFTTQPLMTWAEPERGDIVVFQSEAADMRLVKRVIGLAGDIVMVRQNRLFINGTPAFYTKPRYVDGSLDWSDKEFIPTVVNESFGQGSYGVALLRNDSNFGPVQVPDGHFFVMGDNRDFSADSRYYGFMPRTEVLGKAKGVIVSFNPNGYYLPRKGRSFISFENVQE